MLSLSSYSRHLETNAKILFLSLKYLIYFIKKSALLKDNLLTNFLPSWELDLMSGIFFRKFLKLGRTTLKSYLKLMFLLM